MTDFSGRFLRTKLVTPYRLDRQRHLEKAIPPRDEGAATMGPSARAGEPSMNRPAGGLSSAGILLEQGSRAVIESGKGAPASLPHHGKAYAVPAGDIVGSSGPLAEAAYRIIELLLAAVALTVALPVMLVEAALIRWDSPGPVLFFHTRPGRSIKLRGRDLEGRRDLCPPPGGYEPDALYYVPSYFRLVKFRTMQHDARARYPEFYAYAFTPEEFRQRYGTIPDDPRVTRIGGILRKLSVDELPNLWCVLAGHMRLVGPRPEAPEVLRYYTPEEMYKFACKPGVTGLAQINGRGLLKFGETIKWDLRYIRTRTVWLDLKIILTTIKYVIMRHGAF
jgi:lipopolysaccharide/colanic/teichoic acid biosynthesis glycosyltransferase